MSHTDLASAAARHLNTLCVEISNRRVGSAGNRAATDYFIRCAASYGFQTEAPAFDCLDWHEEGVELSAGDARFQAFASPYALGCDVRARLEAASTRDELRAVASSDVILLIRGALASQQIMPKNFPFYNPDEHQEIIRLLEARQPRAIIAATARDEQMVGSLYPFPLFEDGDFDIPSVYMTDVEGERLAAYAGQDVALRSRATRIPSTACNVIARKGRADRRIVLFAHIDAKRGTPGASDNASGVAVLLLLAELLADYAGRLGIELVAINGEDYFSNPGEQQYLALNAGRFDEILLGINIDGAGYQHGRVAYSLYDCPDEMAALVHEVFSGCVGLVEGERWYQGDHGLFLLNQRPALAITSEQALDLLTQIVHTPADTPDIIDPRKLAEAAGALYHLLTQLDQHYG